MINGEMLLMSAAGVVISTSSCRSASSSLEGRLLDASSPPTTSSALPVLSLLKSNSAMDRGRVAGLLEQEFLSLLSAFPANDGEKLMKLAVAHTVKGLRGLGGGWGAECRIYLP